MSAIFKMAATPSTDQYNCHIELFDPENIDIYPVYTTNRRRAGLVNAHQLVRFRQLFAFTLQQREQD